MDKKNIFMIALIISLLVNSPLALAASSEKLFSKESFSSEELFFADPDLTNTFNCSQSSLTPEEVQAFQKSILETGFTGGELSAGTEPLKDRETLENNTALLVSPDSNEAVKMELPNKEITADEVSFLLNNRYDGAYSFGLLLNDSLRLGQCRDNEADCPLMGNFLTLRTDGEGFKEDFVSVWKDFKGLMSDWFGEKNDVPGEQLPVDTKQMLKDYYESGDEADFAGTIVKKVPGKYMGNSVLTDDFTASMGTTCRDSSCTISLYSFFDKHFNQWFSSNMVIQTAGPTLLFGAKKLFGLSARRGLFGAKFIDVENTKLIQNMRMKLWGPDAFFGKQLGPRIVAQKNKYDGFSEFYEEFVQATIYEKGMADSEATSKIITKYLNPKTSPLYDNGKITVEKKKEFVQLIKDLKRYATTADDYGQEAKKEMDEIVELAGGGNRELGLNTPQGIEARRTYGAKMSRLYGKFDDDLDADFPNSIAAMERLGLWNKGLKNVRTGNVQTISADTDVWNNIMKWFGGNGKYDFAMREATDFEPGTFANAARHWETIGDDLVYYKLEPSLTGDIIPRGDLKAWVARSKTEDLYANIPGHGFIEIRDNTKEFILEQVPGDIKLYKGTWKEAGVLKPEQMGDILADKPTKRLQKAAAMNKQLWGALRERQWAERSYFNAMDKVFANEEKLASAYFRTVGGAAKYTVVPYVYWQAKRGFGVDELSAYMLPESWRTVNYSSGQDQLYDDAYIDFFANSGSDEGDLFARVINNLPWKYVLNTLSDQFNPVKAQYDRYTKPDGGLRTEVGNIAIYSNTSKNCLGCGITLTSAGKSDFSAFFKSKSKTSSIVLEDTPKDEQDNGAVLINYAHHMDLQGKTPDGIPEKIILSEAIKEKKTCQDAIEEAGYGVGFADKHGINPGLYLAATEAASYFVFGMGGSIVSAVQQFVVAAKLQDCVDSSEGYYTHFFVPAFEEQEQVKENTVEYSTQKVSNLIDDASAQMEEMLTGTGTLTQDAVKNVEDQLDSLSGGAKSSDLVQATYDTSGFSRGMMNGIRLFYFWAAGGTNIEPAEYKTTGKTVIKGTNGQTVVSDNETGTLTVDGEPVLTSEDHVRVASTNLAIPAIEYPNDLTLARFSGDPSQLVFRLKINSLGDSSDIIVEDSDLLNCIKEGVMLQTGLPLNSNNLSEAFGKFQELKTLTHSSVFVENGQIIAEGIPRKVAFTDPGLEVYGDRSVKLINSKDDDPELGKLTAMYFENGFILYKESTNEFIFWLKHHEQGKLDQTDVFGLKVTPDTQVNPVTGCEEYVFDLAVLGDPESPAKTEKAKLFNQSLDKMGPYNIFKTDKKTYVFYEDEDCQVHLRIIDNETGNIEYDEAIESLTSTPDGFEVKTADGQTHDFGFSTEDGRPFLDYNGVKELLRTIGGQNGSMWYDPETGMWYAENAQLLPLLDLFRQQGIKTTVDDHGNVSAVPGANTMNINLNDKTAPNLWDLPSLPENLFYLTLFMAALICCMLLTQFSFRKKN